VVVSCLAAGLGEAASLEKDAYFALFHQLLLVIYEKDCKQSEDNQRDRKAVYELVPNGSELRVTNQNKIR
jgi:hypothetical protein